MVTDTFFDKTPESAENEHTCSVDFFNAAQGLAFWETCKPYTADLYVAFAKVRIFVKCEDSVCVDRLREFLKSLFNVTEVFETHSGQALADFKTVTFTVFKPCSELKSDAEKWLTGCTLLNTYRDYFIKTTGISKMRILCGINNYTVNDGNEKNIRNELLDDESYAFIENLAINDVVYATTSAQEEVPEDTRIAIPQTTSTLSSHKWYAYNLFYTKLAENLNKARKGESEQV